MLVEQWFFPVCRLPSIMQRLRAKAMCATHREHSSKHFLSIGGPSLNFLTLTKPLRPGGRPRGYEQASKHPSGALHGARLNNCCSRTSKQLTGGFRATIITLPARTTRLFGLPHCRKPVCNAVAANPELPANRQACPTRARPHAW